jgi:hypothetical protein
LLIVIMVLALLAGLTLLGYTHWIEPLTSADRALETGDYETALADYGRAQARFASWPVMRQVRPTDYHRLVSNQLAAMYRLGDFDGTIEKAQETPSVPDAHFWSGLALYIKGADEEEADARLAWISRAEEEFRSALQGAPDDWDAKFNFELANRLAEELRKKPKTPPKQPIQVLRPKPKEGNQPAKRVG